ncbi:BnaC03g69190D [Brassica napus]|uniref:BnaC03g69190D protein n=1 Tax=Brassica napus TaxID=3708 RepID=A0A078IEI6_BRANA|nr:BnaC03g69190D [Brassica napus]
MAAKLGFDIPPLELGRIIPPCPLPNDAPPETVESSDDIPTENSVYITSHESNADPIDAPLAPKTLSTALVVAEADVMNPISLESGSKDNDKEREYNQEEDKVEDHNVVVEPPTRKRKSQVNTEENMVSNIIGVTRPKNKTQSVIIQVESVEDYPDDGFRWRKYGQKVVTGNANPRSDYRCTYTGCEVKKLVEKSVDNVKLVVATYDRIHEHVPPPECISKSSTKNQSGSSMSQDPRMQTLGLAAKLPANRNHGVMNRNDEPKIDLVIPDGAEGIQGDKGATIS